MPASQGAHCVLSPNNTGSRSRIYGPKAGRVIAVDAACGVGLLAMSQGGKWLSLLAMDVVNTANVLPAFGAAVGFQISADEASAEQVRALPGPPGAD